MLVTAQWPLSIDLFDAQTHRPAGPKKELSRKNRARPPGESPALAPGHRPRPECADPVQIHTRLHLGHRGLFARIPYCYFCR